MRLYTNKTFYIMTFDLLGLHAKILKAVTEAGYTEPTQIQLKAIPKILKGFDIRASAHTGTGKTAAFLLPALNLLVTPSTKPGKGPRILILAPTRELAMQIATQSEKYSTHLNQIKTVCVSGGVPYQTQMRQLSRPYDILIATPGRLIDYMNQGKMTFPRLEMLVLDEADRMLDMGFLEPVEEIVAATPSTRQTLLFSATLRGSVMKLSESLLNKPMDIIVHAEKINQDNISQKIHYTDDLNHKNRLLDHILGDECVEFAIVFTSTKRHADTLVEQLHDKGHNVAALHGDMSQKHRTRTISDLRKGKIDVLVATDVAARGIDVQAITHVINFDMPRNIEDYVHRIGRTGRAGANGTALSFAAGNEFGLVKRIEKFTGKEIDVVEIAGLEPNPLQKSSSYPRQQRNGRPHPGASRKFGGNSGRGGAGGSGRSRDGNDAGSRESYNSNSERGGYNRGTAGGSDRRFGGGTKRDSSDAPRRSGGDFGGEKKRDEASIPDHRSSGSFDSENRRNSAEAPHRSSSGFHRENKRNEAGRGGFGRESRRDEAGSASRGNFGGERRRDETSRGGFGRENRRDEAGSTSRGNFGGERRRDGASVPRRSSGNFGSKNRQDGASGPGRGGSFGARNRRGSVGSRVGSSHSRAKAPDGHQQKP